MTSEIIKIIDNGAYDVVFYESGTKRTVYQKSEKMKKFMETANKRTAIYHGYVDTEIDIYEKEIKQ